MKVGDEVKILSKSIGDDLSRSSIYQKGKRFWITKIYGNGEAPYGRVVVDYRKHSKSGDWFSVNDLELIESEKKKYLLPDELFKI